MAQVGKEAMAEPYDLLLGRNTYNIFASSFAGAEPGNPAAEDVKAWTLEFRNCWASKRCQRRKGDARFDWRCCDKTASLISLVAPSKSTEFR